MPARLVTACTAARDVALKRIKENTQLTCLNQFMLSLFAVGGQVGHSVHSSRGDRVVRPLPN